MSSSVETAAECRIGGQPWTPEELERLGHEDLVAVALSAADARALHEVHCEDPDCVVTRYLAALRVDLERLLTHSWADRLGSEDLEPYTGGEYAVH